MSYRAQAAELEKIQAALRARRNPEWEKQFNGHLRGLGLKRPASVAARELIEEAMRRQGFGPKKAKRSWRGV